MAWRRCALIRILIAVEADCRLGRSAPPSSSCWGSFERRGSSLWIPGSSTSSFQVPGFARHTPAVPDAQRRLAADSKPAQDSRLEEESRAARRYRHQNGCAQSWPHLPSCNPAQTIPTKLLFSYSPRIFHGDLPETAHAIPLHSIYSKRQRFNGFVSIRNPI